MTAKFTVKFVTGLTVRSFRMILIHWQHGQDWLLCFSNALCIRSRSPYPYSIEAQYLKDEDSHVDFGITISQNLKQSLHIQKICKKESYDAVLLIVIRRLYCGLAMQQFCEKVLYFLHYQKNSHNSGEKNCVYPRDPIRGWDAQVILVLHFNEMQV